MNKIYLLLGSNIGNSYGQIELAAREINKATGKLVRRSSLYVTAAWGNRSQPDFLNQVLVIESDLSAGDTLASILEIERKMGRVRTVKNAPRIIDIDILFFNKQIIVQDNLVIPHPEIQNRRFVLVPLNELSPLYVHPVLGKTVHRLLKECEDRLEVKKLYQ